MTSGTGRGVGGDEVGEERMKTLLEPWACGGLFAFNTLKGRLEKFPLSPRAMPPPDRDTRCKVQSLSFPSSEMGLGSL